MTMSEFYDCKEYKETFANLLEYSEKKKLSANS